MENSSHVLVFASQKGGSGKTTLSGHMAVEAERAGFGPVAIIDTDPQGSLAKWWNARDAETPFFVQTSIDELAHDIFALQEAGVRLIVVDTPPAVTTSISRVVAHADMVVVPTRPSPHDLRAVGATVDLIEARQKQLVFVVNCATARARITSETAVSLSQHGTVAPVTLHNRVDYAASMIDGRTVGEVSGASKSADEVSTLWKYLAGRLGRLDAQRDQVLGAAVAQAPAFEVELLTPQPPVRTTPRPPATPAATEGWIGASPDDVEEVTEQVDDAPAPLAAENSNWDGVERRLRDVGPPTGNVDRRQVPVFGRRIQTVK